LNGKTIEEIGYDEKGNKVFLLDKNGKGKEYYENGKIKFEGEYFYGKGGMEKDMIIMEKKYLKLNMEKERLKNLIIKEIYYLMVNI